MKENLFIPVGRVGDMHRMNLDVFCKNVHALTRSLSEYTYTNKHEHRTH